MTLLETPSPPPRPYQPHAESLPSQHGNGGGGKSQQFHHGPTTTTGDPFPPLPQRQQRPGGPQISILRQHPGDTLLMQQYGHQYYRYNGDASAGGRPPVRDVDIAPPPFYGRCGPQHLLNTWASQPLRPSHGSHPARLRQFAYGPTARPFSKQNANTVLQSRYTSYEGSVAETLV